MSNQNIPIVTVSDGVVTTLSVRSPYASGFLDAVSDLHLERLERNIEKLGYGVKESPLFASYFERATLKSELN